MHDVLQILKLLLQNAEADLSDLLRQKNGCDLKIISLQFALSCTHLGKQSPEDLITQQQWQSHQYGKIGRLEQTRARLHKRILNRQADYKLIFAKTMAAESAMKEQQKIEMEITEEKDTETQLDAFLHASLGARHT